MTPFIAPMPESIPANNHGYAIGELVGVRDLDDGHAVISVRTKTSSPKDPYATFELLVSPSTEQGRLHPVYDDDGCIIDVECSDDAIAVGDEVQAWTSVYVVDGKQMLFAHSVHAID